MKARYWVGGCLSLIILLAIFAAAAYWFLRQTSENLVEAYTSWAPLELPRVETNVETNSEETLSVIERFRDFIHALEQGEETGDLSLSADDINALLQYEDWFRRLRGMAHVTIREDLLRAEMSIPLGMFNDRFEGRYLNGTGELAVEMKDDRLRVTIERLEVGGRNLPDEIMNEVRKNNLAAALYDEPSLENFFRLVKSVKIEDGRLVIQPR